MNSKFSRFLVFATGILIYSSSFSQGNRFRTPDTAATATAPPVPDYAILNSWASHPAKHDIGDSIPAPLRKEYVYDSTIDVFFIHPTTYIQKEDDQMNADVNNEWLNKRTDNRTILNQASAFNEFRLFVPRYRQANYSAYLNILGDSKPYFDTAYADVKKAFQYYLAHWNQEHPFFIASHSQGSQHAARLIHELIEGTTLEKKMIAAYIIGMPPFKVPELKTPVCSDSTQTGCYVAWNSFTENYRAMFEFGKIELETVNPLTWTNSPAKGTAAMHDGAIVRDFNSIKTHALSTQIKDKRLIISSDSESVQGSGRAGNLHVMDINLFYVDIRKNLKTRAAAYKKRNQL